MVDQPRGKGSTVQTLCRIKHVGSDLATADFFLCFSLILNHLTCSVFASNLNPFIAFSLTMMFNCYLCLIFDEFCLQNSGDQIIGFSEMLHSMACYSTNLRTGSVDISMYSKPAMINSKLISL